MRAERQSLPGGPSARIETLEVAFEVADAPGPFRTPERAAATLRRELLEALGEVADTLKGDVFLSEVEIDLEDWPADPDLINLRHAFKDALEAALSPHVVSDPSTSKPIPGKAGHISNADVAAEVKQRDGSALRA